MFSLISFTVNNEKQFWTQHSPRAFQHISSSHGQVLLFRVGQALNGAAFAADARSKPLQAARRKSKRAMDVVPAQLEPRRAQPAKISTEFLTGHDHFLT